jgi:beta-phosphoglucomutase-like phosphatase (HAD superfamily)
MTSRRDKRELYLAALALLELEPAGSLAFEDSPAGLHAAKDAGVLCVAVPNDVTRGATFADADVVLSSLAAHSLDEIIQLAVRGREGMERVQCGLKPR